MSSLSCSIFATAKSGTEIEGRGAGDGAVEGEDFADAVLFDGGPERELVGDGARFDGIALHDDFAVAEDVRIYLPDVTTETTTL